MKKTSVVLVFILNPEYKSSSCFLGRENTGKSPEGPSSGLCFKKIPDGQNTDPDFYYQNLCRVSRQLRESFPDIFAQIRAVTLTTIRCTSVCLGRDGSFAPCNFMAGSEKSFRDACAKPWISAAVKAVGTTKTLNLQYQKSHCKLDSGKRT